MTHDKRMNKQMTSDRLMYQREHIGSNMNLSHPMVYIVIQVSGINMLKKILRRGGPV